MRIAVDFDGTLARTTDLICTLIEYRTGRSFRAQDVTKWDWWTEQGLGEAFWKAYDFMDTAGIRGALAPYDGHVGRVLRRLTSIADTVDVVSCNNEVATESIRDWLSMNVPQPTTVGVRCLGRVNLAEKLKLGYDVYIDDSPVLVEAADGYLGVRVLLANTPWNREIPDSQFVRRFHSWADVPALLSEMGGTRRLDKFAEASG